MTAGWFSLLTFSWMNSLMILGYARPLEASDLWKLQDHRSAGVIAETILSSFDADGRRPRMRLKRWREKDGKAQPSLTWAMNDAIKWWFWSGGIPLWFMFVWPVTFTLVFQYLIKFATDSYVAHREGIPAPGIGRGIGFAIALVILQLIGSLCQNHFLYRSTSTGVLLRGGLITAIYSRSLRLTTRARATLPNGRLVNHISTDVSRIDFCCGFFHMFWTAPIQMAICLALLISNLGPSALAGFSVFFILTPTMVWTDKRAKLLQELLGGMKQIKFFAWENPFLDRIGGYRKREMSHVRSMLLIRAANTAVALSMPAMASVVTFIVYAGTGHQLTPSVVFSSLTWFQLLRLPLAMLPISFSSIADARNAIDRLQECFTAELISETFDRDPELKYALEVENASFTWDASEAKEVKEETLFKLKQIDFKVPRGQLLAIVGAVGSGKTSLLQGLIGDMRKTGVLALGSKFVFHPESSRFNGLTFLQNATIRENICFGRPFEAERYWKAIHDACLEADLDALPNSDMTEGISLSGGQKQRVNICRAIYSGSDILIFDDPLSALDAHVGESVFNNVLLDSSSGATRMLVTHALHFLPKVDYIYFMIDGQIAERGTFEEMMANGGEFSRTFDEFVTKNQNDSEGEKVVDLEDADVDENAKKRRAAARGAALMQAEERNTGAVNLQVYKRYFQSGNGVVLLPAVLVTIVLMQTSIMGIYAMLGVAQGFTGLLNVTIIAFVICSASRKLHHDAISHVMHSPMSFFETTPLGRIMNRFSKDIDTIDNMLADSFRTFLNASSSTVGAVVLISILLPWFLIALGIVFVLYAMAATFYRASARETKRLDAILRSSLYSHFSESLSGLATIRAYREEGRFLKENRDWVDVENRAYWLTVTNQRWLGLRIDFLGILLILSVSMLTVGTRFTVSPAQTGVALSCILSIQLSFGWMVSQLADVENNMNSVERIKACRSWPRDGKLEIKDAVLKYRPELPLVLKGLSMTVKGGEKIGIVGRTGAGKSSIMVALFRLVELVSGSISIGLNDVRNAVSIIPQDATLYSGTLRSNLDPFGLHDDARLWDALRPNAPRFTLDGSIEAEGSNLSIGQRSLVSLARALVKDSKILILDEATASVDYETDRKIQDTITTEFHDRTILCIAHRLRTIISYDRVCVMDNGNIAEFDAPEVLHGQNGIFWAMCEHSRITLEDIHRARREPAVRDELEIL
ncbi:P-loop containing nucleoside triphosphate hydrolase protein [Russula aff. rugulosa BPL654]|nr:P-loop containing nucleoside triphosphate hydrolase protein [Russula aff. rugulosa BPL654]